MMISNAHLKYGKMLHELKTFNIAFILAKLWSVTIREAVVIEADWKISRILNRYVEIVLVEAEVENHSATGMLLYFFYHEILMNKITYLADYLNLG